MSKRIYVASPLHPIEGETFTSNMRSARLYCDIIDTHTDWSTKAPHTYLPYILDDTVKDERELALRIGVQILQLCEALVVCGDRISSGMKGEIYKAAVLGMDVFVANENLLDEVSAICDKFGNRVYLFECDDSRLSMSSFTLWNRGCRKVS